MHAHFRSRKEKVFDSWPLINSAHIRSTWAGSLCRCELHCGSASSLLCSTAQTLAPKAQHVGAHKHKVQWKQTSPQSCAPFILIHRQRRNIWGLGFSAKPLKETKDMQTHNVRAESDAEPTTGTFAITQNAQRANLSCPCEIHLYKHTRTHCHTFCRAGPIKETCRFHTGVDWSLLGLHMTAWTMDTTWFPLPTQAGLIHCQQLHTVHFWGVKTDNASQHKKLLHHTQQYAHS